MTDKNRSGLRLKQSLNTIAGVFLSVVGQNSAGIEVQLIALFISEFPHRMGRAFPDGWQRCPEFRTVWKLNPSGQGRDQACGRFAGEGRACNGTEEPRHQDLRLQVGG
jgi:hypothetical protein